MIRMRWLLTSALLLSPPLAAAAQSTRKPNILVIFGDDIGQTNISAYSFGRADVVSDQYYDWTAKNAYIIQYTLYRIQPFLASLKEYPPSQRVGSFSIDQMMDALQRTISATSVK